MGVVVVLKLAFSSVKTDCNCSFKILAISSGVNKQLIRSSWSTKQCQRTLDLKPLHSSKRVCCCLFQERRQ